MKTLLVMLIACAALGCTTEFEEKDAQSVDGYDIEVPEAEPAIIIDNAMTEGFNAEGPWTPADCDCCGGTCYGENFLYANARDAADETPDATATFTPNIPEAGLYAVFIWWPEGDDRATQAPVIIHHAEGRALRILNLQINGSAWRSLGVFRFEVGTSGYVEVQDSRTGFTNADAVGFLHLNP